MQQTTTTSKTQLIREKYGSARAGKEYAQIAREFGVSRSLRIDGLSRRKRALGVGGVVCSIPTLRGRQTLRVEGLGRGKRAVGLGLRFCAHEGAF